MLGDARRSIETLCFSRLLTPSSVASPGLQNKIKMTKYGIQWNRVECFCWLRPCCTPVALLDFGEIVDIERLGDERPDPEEGGIPGVFRGCKCMQKNSRHFCSMLYCFIRGNTKESSAIQMCLLFFGWSFLRSDLIGPAWLGNLMNLARPLTSGGHLCKGSNHSSALQISWWMDYAMDSLRHSAPHCEICWRHARNDIVIVLSSHPCRANNFKVLIHIQFHYQCAAFNHKNWAVA